MFRFLLLILLFLLSLLTVFRAPTNLLWYVSILVTEFCWIFILLIVALLLWRTTESRFSILASVIGVVSLVFYSLPIIGAYRLVPVAKQLFAGNAGATQNANFATSPFSLRRLISGINASKVAYQTYTYDTANQLTLDFYSSITRGRKPCVVIVHGGSWAGGDSQQLPDLNSALAKAGYHVATINYRLAPAYTFPVPVEDLQSALTYLCSNADALSIDCSNLVLLGRSAGGQIVLSAAYKLNNPGIKGVISFYGPADMVWGYANPTNPLVLNSKKVMEDYLGGTYSQVPQQYISSSATNTATPKSVTTLLLHGENDPLVSHLHGLRLDKKLDSLGVTHYDLYFPWATHGFDYTLHGPAGQLSTWSVMQFLKVVTGR